MNWEVVIRVDAVGVSRSSVPTLCDYTKADSAGVVLAINSGGYHLRETSPVRQASQLQPQTRH